MIGKIDLKIPYGDRSIEFSLPRNRLLGILRNKKSAHKNITRLLSESLDKPLAGYRLEDAILGIKDILLVVPDHTRKAHLKEILPHFMKRIKNNSCSIDIIIATGLHKKHSSRQLKELLGKDILRRHRIISHEQKAGSLTNFGYTRNGIPIILNKNLKQYGAVISIGVIEPHLYAGYSGGAKTVAIGLAGADTINVTHGVKFLDNPLTRIGSIDDNPFQRALWEMTSKVPVRFAVNIVNDPDGRPLKILSGELKEVFKSGVAHAKEIFEIQAEAPSDIVICGIGYPKDTNLYQASRAINYILNDKPILKKGGVLIVVAELRDGYGESFTEKLFFEALKNMSSPREFVTEVKQRGCIAGEHRAYMVAKPLLNYKIAFAGKGHKNFMEGLPFPYFKDIYDALDYANSIVGKSAKIYVIPRALSTIARLERGGRHGDI